MRIFATGLIVAGLLIMVSAFNMLNYLSGNFFDIVLIGERYAYIVIGGFLSLFGGVILASQPSKSMDERPLTDKYFDYWESLWHGERIMVAAVGLVLLSFLLPWQLTENMAFPERLQVFYGGVIFIALMWSYPLATIILRESLKPARYLLLNITSLLYLLEKMVIYKSHFIQFNGPGVHQQLSFASGAAIFLFANLLYLCAIVFDMYQEGKLFE